VNIPLLDALENKMIVADGAMGTRLQSLLGGGPTCIDSLNLDPTYAAIVGLVHRSYLDAGAELILTNTYGANQVKLGRHDQQNSVKQINLKGVEIARQAVVACNKRAWIGGSVGPLEISSIRDEYNEELLVEIFQLQIDALLEGGVDCLVLETFQDVQESAAALKVAVATQLPVIFSIGGVQGGRTGTGADVRELAVLATRLGAHAIGCNCRGPFDILETVNLLTQVTSLPIFAKPNAGSPEIDRGRVAYHVGPEQFFRYAKRLAEAGVSIIGGCCGTGPEHIEQLAEALKNRPAAPVRSTSDVRWVEFSPTVSAAVEQAGQVSTNLVQEVFERVPFVVSVEMRPGREKTLEEFVEEARHLAGLGVHLFDVPDNAGARVTIDPLCAATRLQQETRIPTIVHLSTSHRNLVSTQSYLLGCHASGIQGILAVTGDHPNVGDHDKYASRVNDIKSSVNLMNLLGIMNKGKLFNETRCLPSNFYIGGGFNPVRGLTAQIKWLQRKVDAGAKFVFTQPVYREEDVDQMLELTADIPVNILVGIMPLTSKRNADYFASGNIPGIVIPPEILERYQNVTSLEEGQKIGLELAFELIEKIRNKVRGLYILPPFGKNSHHLVGEMVQSLKLSPRTSTGCGIPHDLTSTLDLKLSRTTAL
jgi:methionine synthase I (cobalamin-dependent)/5,10-methylenetetrahydrofolate reductase